MLPTDSIIYFYIILSGFMTVWAFRKTLSHKEKLGEFEYLGFSAFWGIVLIAVWGKLETEFPSPSGELFANPFATGLFLSLVGMICAFFTGSAWIRIKNYRDSHHNK